MATPRKLIAEAARKCAGALSHAMYRESCYQKLLAHFLETDFIVYQEVHVIYKLNGFPYGTGRIDLLCFHKETKKRIVVELKANVSVRLRRDFGQLARYMHHTSCDAGLLLYFSGWSRKVGVHSFDHGSPPPLPVPCTPCPMHLSRTRSR